MRTIKELMSLEGRVALITGGAGYIGSAMAEALAELGAHIVILDVSMQACEEVCARLAKNYGIQCLPLKTDLAIEEEIASVPEVVLEKFNSIDVLINCAAFVGTSDLEGWNTPFEGQTADTWNKAVNVNLTAVFVLSQACTPALKRSGHGSVINIASIYGMQGPDLSLYEGTEMGNAAAYAASKGGLLQFTRWLATVLAPHVRVNAITPGGVERGQAEAFQERYIKRTPLSRMGMEEDFKGAAVYLSSDLSAYVTGQNIVVDGGWTIW